MCRHCQRKLLPFYIKHENNSRPESLKLSSWTLQKYNTVKISQQKYTSRSLNCNSCIGYQLVVSMDFSNISNNLTTVSVCATVDCGRPGIGYTESKNGDVEDTNSLLLFFIILFHKTTYTNIHIQRGCWVS